MSAPSHFLVRVVELLMVTMFADLDGRMPLPRLALFRTASNEWIFDSDPSAPRPPLEVEVPQAEWMCVLGNDVFPIESETIPELLVELVTRIQRRVMDVTGRDWPEVYTGNGFAGLARPTMAPDGRVGWSVLGELPVPFGSLNVCNGSAAALPVVHRTVA